MKWMILYLLGLLALTASPACAMSYDELVEKNKAYYDGTMEKDAYMALLTQVVNDTANTAVTRANALTFRGMLHGQEAEYAKAREDFEAALALDPSFVNAHLLLAVAFSKDKKFEESALSYERAALLSVDKKPLMDSYKEQAVVQRALGAAVPALKLYKELTDNPFAAEKKYVKKYIGLRGPIHALKRSKSRTPVVVIQAGNDERLIQCEFPEKAVPALAELQRGEEIVLACKWKKNEDEIVELGECSLWSPEP